MVGISGPGKYTFNGVLCHSWNTRSLVNVRLTEFYQQKEMYVGYEHMLPNDARMSWDLSFTRVTELKCI